MRIGMIGLGRMGANLARRLLQQHHEVVVHNRTPEKIRELSSEGAISAFTLEDLVSRLASPRIVWLMVPAGNPVEEMLRNLSGKLSQGDILVDGGNSHYRDSMRHYEQLKSKGIHFLDAGTSGGVWGLQEGYCLMVGGEKDVFHTAEPVFQALAPPDGYAYMGPPGAGHFVKMIHNGIEYGMLQAYGEGFEVLAGSSYSLDLPRIAKLWNQGSVVRSWLLELAARAFEKDPKLSKISGYVEDSGEGKWTIQEAMEKNIPVPVITLSLLERFRSRQADSFSAKVIAALRNEFGGHPVTSAKS